MYFSTDNVGAVQAKELTFIDFFKPKPIAPTDVDTLQDFGFTQISSHVWSMFDDTNTLPLIMFLVLVHVGFVLAVLNYYFTQLSDMHITNHFLASVYDKLPFLVNQLGAGFFLLMSTLMCSFMKHSIGLMAITAICFLITGTNKDSCNNTFRWPLIAIFLCILGYIILNRTGLTVFVSFALVTNLFRYTSVFCFLMLFVDYFVYLKKKCLKPSQGTTSFGK